MTSPDPVRRDRLARRILLLIWLAVASWLAWHHAMWRDEVRAFSLALSGGTVFDMLRAVHGEGHPALWYLILRGLHTLAPVRQVLPGAAFAIGAAAACLFALRAPFRWPILALVLFGRFMLYEYTVMARNYGIGMLILFAAAALYRRHRDRGWVIGGLLLLLANTNVHSVILAAGFLLFWLCDVAGESRPGWTRPWRGWLIGAGLAALGAIACVATVYPPFNDAAPIAPAHGPIALAALRAIPAAGTYFEVLLPVGRESAAALAILPLLLFGSLLALIRSPGAVFAGLAAMLGLLFLFAFVYEGFYRHEALLLPFLLTMAWLAREGKGGRWPAAARWAGARRILEAIGTGALAILLALQVWHSVPLVTRTLRGMPASRSAELATILRRPELRDAILLGDPDFQLETLPYYVSNPLYFVRERRFGRWTFFSKAAYRTISPAEYLDVAERFHARTGRPVVILMTEYSFRSGQPGFYRRGTWGPFLLTARDLARFRAETRCLARFGHITRGDESYQVSVVGLPGPGAGCLPDRPIEPIEPESASASLRRASE